MSVQVRHIQTQGHEAGYSDAVIVHELSKAQPADLALSKATRRSQKRGSIDEPSNAYPHSASAPGVSMADRLTRLLSKEQFLRHVGDRLHGGCSADSAAALVLVELDHFHAVTDAVGAATGEKLLRSVAGRICSKTSEASLVARISENGFAVHLPDSGAAPAVAATLLEYLCRPFAIDGRVLSLSASVGISVAAPAQTDAAELFHSAELALHLAISDQQNAVRYFDPAMLERAAYRQCLDPDLRSAIALQDAMPLRALQPQQFQVMYQPKVRLSTGRVTGFEALVRWHHPSRGTIAPNTFIPLAEETGLIHALGEWVLRTACHDAARWAVPIDGVSLNLAVNVSPLQLRDGATFVRTIERALLESGLDPSRLEIELTESALVCDIGDTLAAIRALGVGLALDDFGTGHSSLSRLHLYPFTRLKIDRSFVAALDRPGNAQTHRVSEMMLRAIVSLGASLGLETVVEGIETPAQLAVAARTGCSEMQGYLASPAVPTECTAAIAARSIQVPHRMARARGH